MSEHTDGGLDRIGTVVAKAVGDAADRESHQRGRARFQNAIARRAGAPKVRRWLAWTGACLAVAGSAAAVVALRHGGGEESLTYVTKVDSGAARLSFSDGTTITWLGGAEGRVGGIDANGAELLLRNGKAELAVTPRPRARWAVVAGPFRVHVKGTRFDVSWSAGRGLLEVILYSGAVQVTGGLARDGVWLRPGERLLADVRSGSLRLEPSASLSTIPPPIDPRPASPTPTVQPASTGQPEPARQGPRLSLQGTPPSWSRRVEAGDYQAVLQAARRAGLARCLATCSSGDLDALANAARLGGARGVAIDALASQRRRFPGSDAGITAAFLLGREHETTGAVDEAIRLYERYLSESPSGPHAPDAFGRRLLLLSRGPDQRRARVAAEAYLARYPGGTYARVAQRLLEPR